MGAHESKAAATTEGAQPVAGQEGQTQKIIDEVKTVDGKEEEQNQKTKEEEAPVAIEEPPIAIEEEQSQKAEPVAKEEEQAQKATEETVPVASEAEAVAKEEEQAQKANEEAAPIAKVEEQAQKATEETVPVASEVAEPVAKEEEQEPEKTNEEAAEPVAKEEEQEPEKTNEEATEVVEPVAKEEEQEPEKANEEATEVVEPIAKEEEQEPEKANEEAAPVASEEEEAQKTKVEAAEPVAKEEEQPEETNEEAAPVATEEEQVQKTNSEVPMWRLGSIREVDMLSPMSRRVSEASLRKLRVVKLREGAKVPMRGSPHAAGYDLSACEPVTISAGGRGLVMTGLTIAIPEGTYARIAPRSGLTVKHGINVGAGVIDFDYRGEVGVVLFNHDSEDFEVKQGDRVAQMILEKITTPDVEVFDAVDELGITERGEDGYGSTGVIATLA